MLYPQGHTKLGDDYDILLSLSWISSIGFFPIEQNDMSIAEIYQGFVCLAP
jgi:hypothetical protein